MTDERHVDSRPGLGAILVSYNTRALLVQALGLLQSGPLDWSIVVIDNNSQDGSAAAVAQLFPDVHLIALDENVGFARAVNLGIEELAGKHVLLLNPDCALEPTSQETLIDYLEKHPDVGIVAPALTHPSRTLAALSAGQQPTLLNLAKHYSGISARFSNRRWSLGWHLRASSHMQNAISVEWASGACLLIREEVIRSVGGLTEQWFMYAEDLQFCLRVREAGWSVVHLPDATAEHHIGASSDPVSVSTRWVSVLIDYYRVQWRPRRLTAAAYQGTLFAGLMSRSLLAWARSLSGRDPIAQASWRREAVKNAHWARRALRPERDNLNRAPEPPSKPAATRT